MSTFKKAKVIMLPTKQFNETRLGYYQNVLNLNNFKYDKSLELFKTYDGINVPNPQHLYIISDDKIKVGDWVMIKDDNSIFKSKSNYSTEWKDRCKIIATTDTSLLIDTYINQGDTVKGDLIIKRGSDYTTELKGRINLPQPSQQFIEKFVEEYNKGNVITDVLVEYTFNDFKFMATLCTTKEKEYILKINPKDNTITIKKLKEVYTKEELCQVLEKYTSFIWSEVGIHYPISLGIDAKDKFINSEL